MFIVSRITGEQRESQNESRETRSADQLDKKTRWQDEFDQFDKNWQRTALNRNKWRQIRKALPNSKTRIAVKVSKKELGNLFFLQKETCRSESVEQIISTKHWNEYSNIKKGKLGSG